MGGAGVGGENPRLGEFCCKVEPEEGPELEQEAGLGGEAFHTAGIPRPRLPCASTAQSAKSCFYQTRKDSRRPTSLTDGHPRTDAARPPARDSLAQMQGLLANPRLPPASPALPN